MIERESLVDGTAETGITLASVDGAIELKNVTFHYPSRPDVTVCAGYSLDIKAGEKVCIVYTS